MLVRILGQALGPCRKAVVCAALLALLGLPAAAQEQSRPGGFSEGQVQGIEQIVRDYLLRHPEVLVEALTEFQQRQRVAEQEQRQEAIAKHREELTRDPDAPVLGNPDGDVVIVEFFDYRCPYCRQVADMLRKTVAEDGKIRLVMKEFPILGPQSVQGARAALAAAQQGKYEAFHFALMTEPGDMSQAHIDRVARKVGLDAERLKRDMQAPELDEMLRRNHALAEALSITGTPAFVVGGILVPGAIDEDALKSLIAQARAQPS